MKEREDSLQICSSTQQRSSPMVQCNRRELRRWLLFGEIDISCPARALLTTQSPARALRSLHPAGPPLALHEPCTDTTRRLGQYAIVKEECCAISEGIHIHIKQYRVHSKIDILGCRILWLEVIWKMGYFMIKNIHRLVKRNKIQ